MRAAQESASPPKRGTISGASCMSNVISSHILTLDRTTVPINLIDGYWLEEHLGDGRFGRVFKARDTKLTRLVVIKTPLSLAGTSIDSFLLEMNKTARLQHPSVVTVYNAGTFTDTSKNIRPYLVMEFIAGQTV